MGDTSITNKEDSIYDESGTECDCMKKNTKILIFVIAIVVVIGIFAWGNLHHKNIDSLPSLEQVSNMEDEAQLNSYITDFTKQELTAAWGEPTESSSEDKLYADRLLENAKDALKNPSKIAEKNAFSLYGFWGSSLYIKYNEYLMFDDKTDYACVFDLIKTIIDKLLQQRFENAENDFDFMHGFSGTIYLLAEILRNDNKIFITFFDDFDYISRKYIDAFFYSFLNGTFSEIGFAHGISGNIATVAMISKLIPIDYNKLEQCIKADDHMFKESSEHSCLPSWCNGIAGQILARVIGYTATLNKSTKEVFESSLNSYLEEKYLNVLLSCKQLCLCHGVYGVASVLNYLKDNSKQKKSFPNIYLNVNPMSIQWVNGISYPYESFMTGITGVLYEHLRLINHNIPNTLAAGLYGVEL